MLADTYSEDTHVIDSCGNVFIDLGFPPHEAEILQLRADMMGRLRLWVQDNGLTQAEAAERLGVTQARISDLIRAHWKISLDMLLTLAGRAGIKFKITLDQAA